MPGTNPRQGGPVSGARRLSPLSASGPDAKPDGRKKRVLLVDDHALVRRGLRDLLREERDLEVCAEAEGVGDALRIIEQSRPDIAIVDITLKDGHGLTLIREIRERHPGVLVLALSMHEEKLYAERALRSGAAGYVQKQERADVVLEALRAIQTGRVYVSGLMADELLQRLVGRGVGHESVSLQRLTDREVEILELMGQGLGTRDIARRLQLSPKTVNTHSSHLQAKLGLQSAKELLRYAVSRNVEGG